MSIDRELLWKAWPDGYLAMRGVKTVGGYQCIGINDERSLWMLATSVDFPLAYRGNLHPMDWLVSGGPPYEQDPEWREQMETLRVHAEDGALLPNVDPSDHATWACVLHDLSKAASGLSMDSGVQAIWEQRTWPHAGSCWSLTWQTHSGFQGCTKFRFPDKVDDPALALVLARISFREKSHAA